MNPTQLTRRPAVIGAAGVAVTALVAGAAVVTSAAAATGAPAGTSHTLHLTSKQLKDVIVNDTDVATDKDMQRGKTTGYDVTSCLVNVDTHIANCTVALARRNGLLIGHAKINVQTGHGSGKVTGGTRALRGATGTISVAPGSSQDTTEVTVHYQV